ncbi:MAG: NAD(P)-dependent oxidoreductase [Actinomycetaceae bacterium]|nr:NAD(P)-dependent oxidoreductase [Actinomycetaceae bacterium]
MKIIVPTSTDLDLDLPGVETVAISEFGEVPEEHRDAQAAILWGMQARVSKFVDQLPNVRWYQTLAAGPDGLLGANLPDDVIVTNGVHFHDRPVAEHAAALTLTLTSRVPEMLQHQREHYWSDFGRPRPLHDGKHVRTTVGANVVVWGFGAIGQQVGRVFDALGANVTGVARTGGKRDGFPVVTEADFPQILPDTDILVMVLPASAQTKNIFNQEIVDMLPDRALLINVGRGATVDEGVLVNALNEGKLGGAGLDVFQVEPLPQDSPLWDFENVVISPHSAGGRPDGAASRIAHNFQAWQAGDIDSMVGVVRRPN